MPKFIVIVPQEEIDDYESVEDVCQAIAETLTEYLDFKQVTVAAQTVQE